MDLTPIYDFLGDTLYHIPSPPLRSRTVPMEVLCVGFPRSGTESLQCALLKLGYSHTYHGWDMLFEEPSYLRKWAGLARKKGYGPPALGDLPKVSRDDFDEILGHCMAVTDAPGSVFAAELIAAYPEAKVVLNVRRDLDAWLASLENTVLAAERSRRVRVGAAFCSELFWCYHVFSHYMWARLFRSPGTGTAESATANGKWIYREHCAMVRGLVPKENLLEWSVEDGWEPLCEFLEKKVPAEEFPHANDVGGFGKKVNDILAVRAKRAYRNLALFGLGVVGAVAYFTRYYWTNRG